MYDEREKTVQQIADMFGVPRSTVYGHLNKARPSSVSRGRPRSRSPDRYFAPWVRDRRPGPPKPSSSLPPALAPAAPAPKPSPPAQPDYALLTTQDHLKTQP
ncbi:hypothetical protein ACWCXK_38735 [Streptomyces sp. NPDC001739]|uniref:hypothetical protein n=1 Tax=unclassified Streptomyces TaxID=2593676 RepID=UPI0033346592